MGTCAYCQTVETGLYENSVPICVKCATIRDAEAKGQSRNVHAALVQGLCKATTRAEKAMPLLAIFPVTYLARTAHSISAIQPANYRELARK